MSLNINNKPSFKEYSKNNWESFGVEKSNTDEKLTAQQMADQFFGGKPLVKSEGYELYTDETEPIKEQQIEEVFVYHSFKKIFGDITVKLFASKDGLFLLERYRQLEEPTDKTIVLFMEIDDRYNLHTVMRMKVAKDLDDPKKVPLAGILNFVKEHNVTISPKEMKNLLEKKVLANKQSLFNWLIRIIKSPISEAFNFFTDKIFEKGAEYFESIADGIHSLRIDETGWNPKTEKGEYNPTLIPEYLWQNLKNFYEHSTGENPTPNLLNSKKIVSDIFDNLFELIDGTRKNFTKIIAEMEPFLPKSVYTIISKEIHHFFNKIMSVKTELKKSIPSLESIIYRSYTSANALVCGIYNSIIDIIAGIFSIIGFLFKAKVKVSELKNEVTNNPFLYAEYFLEIVEGIVESLRKFDIIDFLVNCFIFQAQAAYKLYLLLKKSLEITLEQILYYLGYIIGIIIDIVIETLLTGGVADVAKLFEGVASFMKNPLENLSKSVSGVVKVAGDVFEMGIQLIRFIIKKLNEGSKAVFEQLSKWIDDIFGLGKKVKNFVKDIYEEFFSPKVREYLEKIGLHPTKYEDGVFSMCPIS